MTWAGLQGPPQGPPQGSPQQEQAAAVVGRLTGLRQTLAVAESLTGGLVTARLVDVPGASAVLRGGVVAYATELKHLLLDVPADLLDRVGPVHPDVAAAMAAGVAARLGATWGVATTGVAGPGPSDGHQAGTVAVAVAGPAGPSGRQVTVPGDRSAVREGAVQAALGLLLEALADPAARPL